MLAAPSEPRRDEALLGDYVQSGSEDSFAELVRRYRGLVLSIARRATGNLQDAEDIAQACFSDLAANPASVSSSVAGWLRVVAARRSKKWRKDAARRKLVEHAATAGQPTSTSAAADERARLVRLAIEDLPAHLRVPLVMWYRQGLSQAEVAARLRVNRRAVAAGIKDALELLRQRLAGWGVPLSAGLLAGASDSAAGTEHSASQPAMSSPGGNAATVPVASKGMAAYLLHHVLRFLARRWAAAVAIGLVGGVALIAAGPAAFGPPRLGPYDVVREAYAPHVRTDDDPFGFSRKIASMAASRYDFWRGGEDLFMRWARHDAADWLSDRQSLVTSPGEVHLGSVAPYAAASERRPIAVGFTDFHNSARLPFQLDLVQALVELRLTADERHIALDERRQRQLAHTLIGAYRRSFDSPPKPAPARPWSGSPVYRSVADPRLTQARLLQRYARGGRFESYVPAEGGMAAERLLPAAPRRDEFAAAIHGTAMRSRELYEELRVRGHVEIANAVRDVAERLPAGSREPTATRQFLVLMERPLRAAAGDAILLFEQHLPAAAERQGLTAARWEPAARRAVEDVRGTAAPWPLVLSWCELDGASYRISLFEPRPDLSDLGRVRDFNGLLAAGDFLGQQLSRMHATSADASQLLARFDGHTAERIVHKAESYLT